MMFDNKIAGFSGGVNNQCLTECSFPNRSSHFVGIKKKIFYAGNEK